LAPFIVGLDQIPESVRFVCTPSPQVWSDLSEVGVAKIHAVVRDRSPKLNQRARLDCGHRGCTSIHLLVAEPAGQYDTEPVMLPAYRQTVKWFCQENDTFLPAFETATPRGSTSGGRGTDHIIFPSRALIECMPV